ncbi:MAG: DUF4272 domain-containing protein [Snodgrassella sp.]|nr:DUF4272 domain-containing protein [Snodgrassella sp.]
MAALLNNKRNFIYNTQPTVRDAINMSWKYEALLLLQWTLNWQAQLLFVDAICDVSSLVDERMR